MIVASSVFARRCAGLFGPFGYYDISAVFFADIVGCLRFCMILNNMPDSANSFGREKNSVHTICTLFPLNIRRSRLLPCKQYSYHGNNRDYISLRMCTCSACGMFYERLEAVTSSLFYFVKNGQINEKTGRKERKRIRFKEKKEGKGIVTLF